MAQISKAKRSARLCWARERQARLPAARQAEELLRVPAGAAQPRRSRPRRQVQVPGPGVYLGTRSRAGAAAPLHDVGMLPPPAPSPSPSPPPTPVMSSPPVIKGETGDVFRVLPKMEEPLTIKEEPLPFKLEDANLTQEVIKKEEIKEEPVLQDVRVDERQDDGVGGAREFIWSFQKYISKL
ncbi:uncharacterized protein EDB91DRAFT_1089645 [Suillus paluster]|uniref:uncharacterized protein n=1 Tax=Suillus paluster TaxID=48578 RepID=UPI001B8737C2|nr:uncharacterized protein EDB91DRAFT_1089645 [Suillus paluster]KAG1718940.1 hypothetical protein EDB91DRAFT_1089645 [Suillus paluster]